MTSDKSSQTDIPTSKFLNDDLNRRPTTSSRYFTVASNFDPTPTDNKLVRIARNHATDVVFAQKENDLVVPTVGPTSWPNGLPLDVDRRILFDQLEGFDHSAYWDRPKFTKSLLDWLRTT